jgi:hypothetical protein
MKCIDCKWYVGQTNDTYGVCKRYPQIANKSQHDWCGDYVSKVVLVTPAQEKLVEKYEIQFTEETEYDIHTDEIKPKRGRKPKA